MPKFNHPGFTNVKDTIEIEAKYKLKRMNDFDSFKTSKSIESCNRTLSKIKRCMHNHSTNAYRFQCAGLINSREGYQWNS